jgi:hypothetical protein
MSLKTDGPHVKMNVEVSMNCSTIAFEMRPVDPDHEESGSDRICLIDNLPSFCFSSSNFSRSQMSDSFLLKK